MTRRHVNAFWFSQWLDQHHCYVVVPRTLGERGYAIYDDLIHGYGTDIHPPLVDRSCVQYWRDGLGPPPGRSIEGGMAIVIQPNPITPDERMGLQLGALTLVTDAGAESLHGIPLEPPA
jgi:hypothetical protein